MAGPVPSSTVESVLREEISLGRALLTAQREVWESLCQAEPAHLLVPRLVQQESALDASRQAARRRAEALVLVGGMDAWLLTLPLAVANSIRTLRSEAHQLKGEIQALATQCTWLARRSAYWLEAQRALIGELAAERLGPGTYGGGGQKRREGQVTASVLDRSA